MGAVTTARGMDAMKKARNRPVTGVWIDAAKAIIVRLQGNQTRLIRLESTVPSHRKSTGHIRHDPATRHGGGGSPQTAGEPHRLEHLKQFVVDIETRLPRGDDLLILGPGTVHERLERDLSRGDERHARHREIRSEASPPVTDRQLIARLRRFAGVEPRRRSAGPYRRSRPSTHHPSGQNDKG